MQNIDELEAFLLRHGENIVDMLGGEIDRIELKLKVNKIIYELISLIISIFVISNFESKDVSK